MTSRCLESCSTSRAATSRYTICCRIFQRHRDTEIIKDGSTTNAPPVSSLETYAGTEDMFIVRAWCIFSVSVWRNPPSGECPPWLQRMVIGLGMGASVADAQLDLCQYSNGSSTQLSTFVTHAASVQMLGVGITRPADAAGGWCSGSHRLERNGHGRQEREIVDGLPDRSECEATPQSDEQLFSQQVWNRSAPGS